MGVHIVETYRTAEFQMLLLLFSGLLYHVKVKENATRLQRYQSRVHTATKTCYFQ